VAWVDARGNSHDLDYVLEQGGSETVSGQPKAFIEMAWRRYTKHSRNKAQEIQGAILPLAERYAGSRPFLGVVLAGVYTEASLQQLRSNGFQVLHIPYESVKTAFAKLGVDAQFDEHTPDTQMARQVARYEKLNAAKKAEISAQLVALHLAEIAAFLQQLDTVLTRRVKSVRLLGLHGCAQTVPGVSDAIGWITAHPETESPHAFVRYEVLVEYGNGDEVRGQFSGKPDAIAFLRALEQA